MYLSSRSSTLRVAIRLGLNLLAVLLFFSCSNRSWDLVSEEDVRRLLPRYAMLSAGLQNRGEADSIRQAAYRQFFEAEGYTLQDWDSSMLWYAKNNMPLYHDYYRLASDSLSRLTEVIQRKVDSIARVEERQRKFRGAILDSVNLLSLGARVALSNQLVNQHFSLQPSSPYMGVEGTLSVRVSGLPKLSDKNAFRLELRFHEKDSTSRVERISIKRSGLYKVRLVTIEGKDVVRISGHLRGTIPTLGKQAFVWVDSLRFVRKPHANLPNPKLEKAKADSIKNTPNTQDWGEENTVEVL